MFIVDWNFHFMYELYDVRLLVFLFVREYITKMLGITSYDRVL